MRALVDHRLPMSPLNVVLGVCSGLAAVAYASFFLCCAAPTLLIPRGRRERFNAWTNAGASYAILRFAFLADLDVQGRERVPEAGQPYLVVANHRAFPDVLTLIWAAGAEGISKREVLWFPAMGWLGYLGGAVFFDRSDPAERARAKEESLFLLRQGVPLHVYPEGRRTRDGRLGQDLRLGMLLAAYEAGIPLLPAAMWGTDRILPNTMDGVRFRQQIRCHFGELVRPADFQDGHAFAMAAWSQVVERVEAFEREDP